MKLDPTVTILYAVRHGETEWNKRGLRQGHLDSQLSDMGIRQAHAVANGLVGRGIDTIITSDLGRARATANIIAERIGISVVDNENLREQNLGLMQGMTQEEFRDCYPEEFDKYRSRDPGYAFPGGESSTDFHQRSTNCCKSIGALNRGHTILIVTHGGVLKALITDVLDLEIGSNRRFSLFNAAINRFTIDREEWHLDTWGEVSHLEQTVDEG